MSEDAGWRELEWDTGFFGAGRIARAEPGTPSEVDAALERSEAAGVACTYLLISGHARAAAQRAAGSPGALHADTRITFACDVSPEAGAPTVATEDLGDDEVERLVEVARRAYLGSRFFMDPRIDDARAAELYAVWLERSLEGGADHVCIARAQGRAVGFVTAHLEGASSGRIGLVGLADEARGRGLGREMVEDTLRWFAARGIARVEVATQATNVAAQRLYGACGFRVTRSEHWFHVWR